MITNIIGENNTIFNHFISELRDVEIQKDSMRFRRNLERIGEVFAYEISKELKYYKKNIKTPLGISEMKLFNNQPILATILRAGIPLHQGLLNYFDSSPSAFISASRNHIDEKKIDVKIEYLASPKIDNQIIVLSDPMLASGSSMLLALNTLLDIGTPSFVHIVSSIASKEGVDYLKKNIKFRHCKLWLGAVDNQLNDKSYIVPGLGDAGDLAFGIKY